MKTISIVLAGAALITLTACQGATSQAPNQSPSPNRPVTVSSVQPNMETIDTGDQQLDMETFCDHGNRIYMIISSNGTTSITSVARC